MKNKFKKLAVLSLFGLLGLTACSTDETTDIFAKPTGYSDPVVTFNTEAGYKNMEEVYDAWREGYISSDVLDQMLYQYSISAFGRYNKYIATDKTEDYTLEDAAKDIKNKGYSGISQKTKTFILNHSAYHVLTATGTHDLEEECALVEGKYDAIEKRIAIAMYDMAASGSYTKDSYFSEKRMLRSLKSDSEDVANPETIKDEDLYNGLILPEVEPEEVFDGTDPILHREYYQSDTIHYVEKKIIPTIYNELLNEQYLFNEASGTVGRSRARKINVFSISARSGLEDTKSAEYLINYLFEVLTAQPGTTFDNPDWGKTDKLDLFKDFSNAWIGVVEKDITSGKYGNDILDHILAQQKDERKEAGDEDTRVFGERGDRTNADFNYASTDRGVWMKDYNKIKDNLKETDTALESTYTGSGSYSKEWGKELKERETALKDYTTNGWYISSVGVSSLPESISSRLFNIAVADAKKETKDATAGKECATLYDRWQNVGGGKYEYSAEKDYNTYLACINGAYYLKNNDLVPGSENQDIIFKDGSTYYIVQVLEAVNTTKMGSTSLSYASLGRDAGEIQDMTNEIAKMIAEGSTYQDLAKNHWLKQMAIKYHDTVVYDYFKENYPNLFDE